MSFLDRFKPQPRWRHADPEIRAAAVLEIPDGQEHDAVLVELAADPDPRVRRAAIDRIATVDVLVRLARSEQDADLVRELTDRLVNVAVTPADTDADGARALDGLDDPKQLATIAKGSPHDTVRAAALGRVHDSRLLGSIARHADDPQTAADAVARIADVQELLNTALKTDHKDAGVVALERAAEATGPDQRRDMLDGVANRAKNKSVSKRAKAMMQAIEEAAASRRLAQEQWQQRVAGMLARVEAMAAVPDGAAQLDDAETEWRALASAGEFGLDPDSEARFTSLLQSGRAAIAEHERALAEQRAEAERRQALLVARVALCERVEGVSAEGAPAAVDQARAEWSALGAPGAPDADIDLVTARFEAASARAAERYQNILEQEKTHARMAELAEEAERLAAQDELPVEAWNTVRREWGMLQPRTEALDPAVAQRYSDADARVRQCAEDRRAAAERARRQQVQRIEQLIERATKRAAAEDLTLREADRLARELRNAAEGPHDRDLQPLVEPLKAAHAAVAPRLHELREMDEWKRFANAAVQEELIAKTEALRTKYGFDNPEGVKLEDLDKVARELHEIQERWKQAAEAPRAQAQALWHRYRQAADPIQVRVREFFAQRGEERKQNLEGKLALIERAEALADSTDWIRTAEELKRLQAEWQAIGAVPRQDTRVTWKRFREACDKFFTRRNADLAERKETWSANLARKEALCARAEHLAASTEWDRGAAEIRRMQVEWKAIGPVRRNKSEVVWQRFRTACDTFFDRYKRRDEIELETKQADREALVNELESLVPGERSDASEPLVPDVTGDIAPPAPQPMDTTLLVEQVRSLRSRWNQTSPAVRQGADPLSARFMGALERLMAAYPGAFRGTELDADANRQKMESLCQRVEGFLSETGAAPPSSSQALAAMLREALAANTIGGRAGEEAKWRGMSEDVRHAQAAWNRLGPVPGDAGRHLADRFHRACSRFFDAYRRHVPQQPAPQRGGRPVGAR